MLEGDDPAALFPRYADYPDAARIAVLRTHLARLRSLMRRFMDAQSIAQQASLPAVDASWGFQTRMSMARNAVFELRPRYVRGYGELDAQGEQDCRALAAELGLLLDDITHELRRQPLAIPESRRDDALLVALTEAIERHQLLELRGTVRNLLEGQESDRVEVALLGRVSSGKSSLVNALLEQPLLPVGAVPVTAVVTRVRHGDALRIRAIDLEGHVEEITAAVLPQYIAESGNAGNRRRLREVTIEAPADILHGGIVLTDTPGLGSLHATASAHALTYLPRCDLGIITIDASATLSMQDADLARALQQAHASLLVLLTKADTVAADALEQQRDYVQRSLSEALGEPIRVADVSVAPAHSGAMRHWRDTVLRPVLAQCAARSGERAAQRLDQLARRVCVTLEQALHESPAATETTARQGSGAALAALSDAETALRNLCSELGQHGAAVVLNDALPLAMADASDIAGQVVALASQLADQVVRDMVARLQAVNRQADDGQWPASLRGAPPFVLAALPDASPQRYTVRGPPPWRRYRLRQRLRQDMQFPLQQTFLAYAQELKEWLTRTCESLRQSVGGVVLATDGARTDQTAIREDLARLHILLDEGPSAVSAGEPP
ncbi:dynamin family protein [Rhodanobacter sp. Si-c]|uniref:Dynamin family protein n=1 Tax=Rhodanobacter lycopersici TaxID=3162487 RepID=A0ABV3Q9A6_9GAMM